MHLLAERVSEHATDELRPAADHVRHRRHAPSCPRRTDHLEGYRGSARCGSATPRPTSSSSTSTASSSTRSTSTTSGAAHLQRPAGTTLCALRGLGVRPLGPARRGDLGDPRRPQELPVLPADVLGGDRAGHPDGQPPRPARRPRAAGARPATRSTGRSWSEGWTTDAAGVRPVRGQRRPRRVRPDDAAGRVHRAHRPEVARPPWTRSTDELVSDSLVYRYDPEASPDGLRGAEGTFSICSFWYVEALTRAGRLDEARLAFEKMLTYANHLGLYAEEIGHTGEQLGNFPQAFTHLALISAAFNLDRRAEPARWAEGRACAGDDVSAARGSRYSSSHRTRPRRPRRAARRASSRRDHRGRVRRPAREPPAVERARRRHARSTGATITCSSRCSIRSRRASFRPVRSRRRCATSCAGRRTCGSQLGRGDRVRPRSSASSTRRARYWARPSTSPTTASSSQVVRGSRTSAMTSSPSTPRA